MSFGIEMEIKDSLKKALKKKGIIGLLGLLFDDRKAAEGVAKEAAEDLKRKGLADETREHLSKLLDVLFNEECADGYTLRDYLAEEGITLDQNNVLWFEGKPVALLGRYSIMPIKGTGGRVQRSFAKNSADKGYRVQC